MSDSSTQADKPRIAISTCLLDTPESRQYCPGMVPLVVPLILLMQESPCN
ncbi:hypothetical protein ACVNP3_25355 [Pseudomonas chlororaphis subsp. piscium]